jgi:SAM-dependent methyltransferase
MQEPPAFQPLSWRDPDGFVVKVSGRILRAVSALKSEQTKSLLSAPWMKRLIEEGSVPRTVELTDSPPIFDQKPNDRLWLEHEPLDFPCYPHEITALQLYDSAVLTLNVAIEAARAGWTLKDASAWNVLHSRGRAVFVDLLSFERSTSGATWVAYGQFVRHFVLPLILQRKLAVQPADVFLTDRDGVAPERAYEMLGGMGLISLAGFETVLLPKWLSRAGGRLIESRSVKTSVPQAATAMDRELLLNTLHRLQRMLERLQPDWATTKSLWKGYEEERAHYSQADLAQKREFVRQHLPSAGRVLDLGCNAGEFSRIASDRGNVVIAADFDHPALTRLYMRIRGSGKPITPIHLNIGRPTPAVGWVNNEVASFLDRAAGQFDCILALGLIHHLLVSERASLPMIIDAFDQLSPKSVIVEWVDPKDPKFHQLAGLNSALYSHLDAETFECAFVQKFAVKAKLHLPCGTRVMYLLERY